MALGPGYQDAQGVYHFGEDDTETLMSDLLNLGQESVSEQFGLDRARLTSLEADTGWLTPTLQNGWVVQGGFPVRYRRKGGIVYLRGRTTSGTNTQVFVLPAGFRPGQSMSYYNAELVVGTTGAVTAVTSKIAIFDIAIYIAEA